MSSTLYLPFGELLQKLRKQKKISQQALANKLGVHRNTISAWERGEYLPDTKGIVLELAKQLQLGDDEARQLLEASLTALSPYWHVPYQRNPFFTGRYAFLETLHHRLCSEHSVTLSQSYALSGLGGIGKTQLALEYVYQHATDYYATFWVTAETKETLYSGFATIASKLQFPEHEEQEAEKVVHAVLQWLNTHKEWLLIFDNVEDLSLLKPFLPSARQGIVLITTRLRALEDLSYPLELPPLPDDEGVQFLLHRARLVDPIVSSNPLPSNLAEPALAIVNAVGGLPLALDQAGAYIQRTGCSLLDYLHLFQDHQISLLSERSEMAHHPTSVVKTFQLSFERIKQVNKAAADLLCFCSFLAPDAIPEELFTMGARSLRFRSNVVSTDAYRFNQMLGEALRYSLLDRQPQNRTLSMHRLVQAVLRDMLSEEDQRIWQEQAMLVLNMVFPDVRQKAMLEDSVAFSDVGHSAWPLCERLLPHALVCAAWGENEPIHAPKDLANLLNKTGTYLRERGQYAEAEPLLKRGLEISEQYLGPDHLDTALSLGSLAILYMHQGKHEQAEPLYLRALTIREKRLGAEHPLTSLSLRGLAHLYRQQGKYEQAEPLYLRALEIGEQKLGVEHPDTAMSLNDLAIFYWRQGKYEQMEPLLRRAFAIREGAEHPDMAMNLNSLANLYRQQGKYQQAESLLQRVLAIFEQHLGATHPRTAGCLNGLANLYLLQGKYEQAEPLYLRALKIREQKLGVEHPDTAMNLNSLANLYRQQGKYEQAEPLYLRALTIFEQHLGTDHSWTARSLNGLANLYRQQGKYEQAEPLYLRALMIFEQHLGTDHPRVARSLNDLANLYWQQEKYEQAESLYLRALAIREQRLGTEHHDTAESLHNLAELFRCQGRYEQAETLYQRALSLFEMHLGTEHPTTAHPLHGLAQLYQRQEKYEQSEMFYRRTLTIREGRLGPAHPETQETRNAYAALLRLMGRDAEATALETNHDPSNP